MRVPTIHYLPYVLSLVLDVEEQRLSPSKQVQRPCSVNQSPVPPFQGEPPDYGGPDLKVATYLVDFQLELEWLVYSVYNPQHHKSGPRLARF